MQDPEEIKVIDANEIASAAAAAPVPSSDNAVDAVSAIKPDFPPADPSVELVCFSLLSSLLSQPTFNSTHSHSCTL